MQLAMHLIASPASSPRRPSNKRTKGKKCRVARYKTPGTPYYSTSMPSMANYPENFSGERGHQCSSHACREYCPLLSDSGRESAGVPYLPNSLMPQVDC